jgi:glycerophosphoryl diester phosphodiesterase
MPLPKPSARPYADLMFRFDRSPAPGLGVALWLGGLIVGTLAQPATTPAVNVNQLIQLDRPLVIAHRGYSQMAPENTLPAFRLALISGADLVELDYHHTRDNVPVVLHDATLDRTTDIQSRWNRTNVTVASLPAADLVELDAGSWFDPLFKDVRIPLLTEALDLIQTGSVTLIERKAGDAPTLIELLRDRGLVDRVVVQAFDWSFVQHCRELAPNLVLGALGPPSSRDGRQLTDSEKWLNAAYLDEIEAVGAELVVWNRQVTPSSIAAAHRRGLRVWVYTINEPATAAVLVRLGVNGIITDNPALIWKGLANIPASPEP